MRLWLGQRKREADNAGGRSIESYVSHYQERLDESVTLSLDSLQDDHYHLETNLHRQAHDSGVDLSAFLYSCQRLPDCLQQTRRVIIGPHEKAFVTAGYPGFNEWLRVSARARRRRAHFDGGGTLALFATSISDLDDIIPALCAYQIEWNKMHRRLVRAGLTGLSAGDGALRRALGLSYSDWTMLVEAMGRDLDRLLTAVAEAPKHLTVQRLALRGRDFAGSVEDWWREVLAASPVEDCLERPIFLVSSNNHGLANLVSGFAGRYRKDILDFIFEKDPEHFRNAWRRSKWHSDLDRQDLVYYAQRLFLDGNPDLEAEKRAMEQSAGLRRVFPAYAFPNEAQYLELNSLSPESLDPRLTVGDWARLKKSRAIIINMDYPLGFGAYHLMHWACGHFAGLQGIWVIGKSAAMIGRLGDILLPRQVKDVHSGNLYDIGNCITVRHLAPFLRETAVFDDQKSLTVRGTFLHSWDAVKAYHRADFTGIEMEAGPCLSAIYEYLTQKKRPRNQSVSLASRPGFYLGLMHYTSDTPYNIRANLLNSRLGLRGLEASYVCSLATMQLILNLETSR